MLTPANRQQCTKGKADRLRTSAVGCHSNVYLAAPTPVGSLVAACAVTYPRLVVFLFSFPPPDVGTDQDHVLSQESVHHHRGAFRHGVTRTLIVCSLPNPAAKAAAVIHHANSQSSQSTTHYFLVCHDCSQCLFLETYRSSSTHLMSIVHAMATRLTDVAKAA